VLQNQPPLLVIQQVVSRLSETATGDLAFKRYKNQLRVLSQLRKLNQLTNTIMDSIAEFFREEDDVLYILGERNGRAEGEAKGEAKALRKLVLGLIEKSNMSVEQIADLADVPVEYVTNLKNEQAPNP
jgi:predicted transposase YdaD